MKLGKTQTQSNRGWFGWVPMDTGFIAMPKYWCILLYHKCKVEYIELRVMKVVLISVIIGEKKLINIVLKSEMSQFF